LARPADQKDAQTDLRPTEGFGGDAPQGRVMRDRDPRAVLGLPSDATRGEAQRAFRRLAKQTHPDAGGNAADFRAVVGAWAELGSVLPIEVRPVAPRPAAPSPHVLAYRAATTRVVWAEPRPPVAAPAPDFHSILQAALARQAA
jgi:hypothetical protein